VITLGAVGSPPTVQVVSGPNTPRTYASAVVLPNGEVALFGGSTQALEFNDAPAVLEAGA
jgi:hypothetical protein